MLCFDGLIGKMEAKATCPECGSEFLQSTADSNNGFCFRCKPKKTRGADHEEIAGKMELSLRLLLAAIFAIIFAGVGYGAGSAIWSGIGVLLALIGFPIGAIYGFFCREINSLIRVVFRSLFHFDGD